MLTNSILQNEQSFSLNFLPVFPETNNGWYAAAATFSFSQVFLKWKEVSKKTVVGLRTHERTWIGFHKSQEKKEKLDWLAFCHKKNVSLFQKFAVPIIKLDLLQTPEMSLKAFDSIISHLLPMFVCRAWKFISQTISLYTPQERQRKNLDILKREENFYKIKFCSLSLILIFRMASLKNAPEFFSLTPCKLAWLVWRIWAKRKWKFASRQIVRTNRFRYASHKWRYFFSNSKFHEKWVESSSFLRSPPLKVSLVPWCVHVFTIFHGLPAKSKK